MKLHILICSIWKNPDNGGYVIMAGLQQLIEAIKDMHFSKGDIDYLQYIKYVWWRIFILFSWFQVDGTIWAVPEGTPVFPYEPLVTVKGKLIEAQLLETFLLVTINHQSLIATKTHRIVQEAKGPVLLWNLGQEWAQGYDGATYGARAAYIGGAAGTATVSAGKAFGIPVLGTMAHSFVQSFDTEYDAFKAYAEIYPDSCILLVDTYDTLKSGIPNAIRVAEEVLQPMGKTLAGIRIDSGDIAYLTKKARMMLDVAGLTNTKISISNSLDEYLIRSVLEQGARIDSFGVGENMITSKSSPVFGGVYKMAGYGKGW